MANSLLILVILCLQMPLVLLQSLTSADSDYGLRREYDICNPKTPMSDPPRAYLPKVGDFTEIFINWTYSIGQQNSNTCLMLFRTCPACRIRVDAADLRFSYTRCSRQYSTDDTNWPDECFPGCVYFHLFDSQYKEHTSVQVSRSSDVYGYASQSRQLHVVACGQGTIPFNISMRLKLISEEKYQLIAGDAFDPVPRRTFTSPYFPKPYVQNGEIYKYKFEGSSQTDYITVTFDDWLVSPFSEFQVEGANVVNKITGQNKRPYIISDGPTMTMTFNTGEHRISGTYYSFLGFRAVARFYKDRREIPLIETDCGSGDVVGTSLGGIINLKSVADGLNRDCIWVIKKAPEFSGVYLKVLRYRGGWDDSVTEVAREYSLEIRGGITSVSDQRLKLIPSVRQPPSYSSQTSDEGFYIRLKGSYLSEDSLLISYTMYNTGCVDRRSYFKCANGRCIPEFLQCDSYDHCGDDSDEDLCGSTGSTSRGSSSYSYSISIGVIIPMVVSVFLVIIMCLLIIFIRRCRRLNNAACGRPHHGPPTHQGRGRRHRRRRNQNVQMSVTVSSGDHPPSYNEVIQNTPIGYLNMAFSWSQCDHGLAQPPSYEEATTPSALPSYDEDTNASSTAPRSGSNSHNHSNNNNAGSLHCQAGKIVAMPLSPSLDPRAYVSSSSSSEEISEPGHHSDMTSSDTSTDNEHSLVPRSQMDLSQSSMDPAKDDGAEGEAAISFSNEGYNRDSNAKCSSDVAAAEVVLESPTSVKYVANKNSQGSSQDGERGAIEAFSENPETGEAKENSRIYLNSEGRSESSVQREADGDSRRPGESGERSERDGQVSRGPRIVDDHSLRNPQTENESQGASRGTTDGRGNRARNDQRGKRRSGSTPRNAHEGRRRRRHQEDGRRGREGGSDNRERRRNERGEAGTSDTYPDHRSRNDRRPHSRRDHSCPEKENQASVKNSSESHMPLGQQMLAMGIQEPRSRSCFDLSMGAMGGVDQPMVDKRFSYAVDGDLSQLRSSRDPFDQGRCLLRERQRGHMDRHGAESCGQLDNQCTSHSRENLDAKCGKQVDNVSGDSHGQMHAGIENPSNNREGQEPRYLDSTQFSPCVPTQGKVYNNKIQGRNSLSANTSQQHNVDSSTTDGFPNRDQFECEASQSQDNRRGTLSNFAQRPQGHPTKGICPAPPAPPHPMFPKQVRVPDAISLTQAQRHQTFEDPVRNAQRLDPRKMSRPERQHPQMMNNSKSQGTHNPRRAPNTSDQRQNQLTAEKGRPQDFSHTAGRGNESKWLNAGNPEPMRMHDVDKYNARDQRNRDTPSDVNVRTSMSNSMPSNGAPCVQRPALVPGYRDDVASGPQNWATRSGTGIAQCTDMRRNVATGIPKRTNMHPNHVTGPQNGANSKPDLFRSHQAVTPKASGVIWGPKGKPGLPNTPHQQSDPGKRDQILAHNKPVSSDGRQIAGPPSHLLNSSAPSGSHSGPRQRTSLPKSSPGSLDVSVISSGQQSLHMSGGQLPQQGCLPGSLDKSVHSDSQHRSYPNTGHPNRQRSSSELPDVPVSAAAEQRPHQNMGYPSRQGSSSDPFNNLRSSGAPQRSHSNFEPRSSGSQGTSVNAGHQYRLEPSSGHASPGDLSTASVNRATSNDPHQGSIPRNGVYSNETRPIDWMPLNGQVSVRDRPDLRHRQHAESVTQARSNTGEATREEAERRNNCDGELNQSTPPYFSPEGKVLFEATEEDIFV